MKLDNKSKVALYIYQGPKDKVSYGYTTEEQIRELKNYCEQNDLQIVKEYIDIDENRENIDILIKDAENKRFDNVLVWKSKQLGRDVDEVIGIINTLCESNINFRSYRENLETETPMGRFTIQLMAAMIEYEKKYGVA